MSTNNKGYFCFALSNTNTGDHRLFCSLPSRIDKKTEMALLSGNHPLNNDFDLVPLITQDPGGKTLSRAALTFYPDDDTAYLGLFASKNDSQACGTLMSKAEAIAREHGSKRIIGPVDASVWIGYRFKTDAFKSEAYYGEPTNPRFYPELWKMCGFKEMSRYSARILPVPDAMTADPKCASRLLRAKEMGYRFEHPSLFGMRNAFEEIRKLVCRLLDGKDNFHPVSRSQFSKMTATIALWSDPSMILMVYAPDSTELAGFTLCVPDFASADDNSFLTKWKLRKTARKYVVSYMAVSPGHEGLAAAMSQLLRDELLQRQAASVSFPIKEGNSIREFYSDYAEENRHYALYAKMLF